MLLLKGMRVAADLMPREESAGVRGVFMRAHITRSAGEAGHNAPRYWTAELAQRTTKRAGCPHSQACAGEAGHMAARYLVQALDGRLRARVSQRMLEAGADARTPRGNKAWLPDARCAAGSGTGRSKPNMGGGGGVMGYGVLSNLAGTH
jgi:hypothetical protein